jgi:uncharacterized membrane protein YeaQ/YmgE (transglycosylase-associated protein family)
MNLLLGMLVGALVGWIAFKSLPIGSQQGVRSALMIGPLGGGIGAQLAVMFEATKITDGDFNLVSLVASAIAAAAFLYAFKYIADRRRA